MNRTVAGFIRRILEAWIKRLDRAEGKTARGRKETILSKEFHLPPWVIGAVTAALVFGTLVGGAEASPTRAAALALFVATLMILFSIYLNEDQADLVKSDDAMSLLAVIFLTTLIFIKLAVLAESKIPWFDSYATPFTIAPLLATLLLNARLGLVLSAPVAIIFGLLNRYSLPLAVVAAIGCTVMVASVKSARTAHQVAKAGLLVGLVQAITTFFFSLILGWSGTAAAISIAASFIGPVVAVIFSLGVRTYLESFFSRISNLTLVELAAVNHPLLRKMSMEAPGTYHHSLIVATLAEDAANAIGANGLLCRVGAYFHDIGKMAKAEYFIENQGTLGNPHDQVSPSLSKLVITAHVKEGMALGKAHKLDQQIVDFIPQHHGTSRIEYFFHKAIKLEGVEEEDFKEDVEADTYRYPGPKPQSRETAIVMMADSVEAASRTLEDPNHQRFKDLVQKIINKKVSDGQFEECPLTLADLHTIGERFTATLTSLYHARIPYPETTPAAAQE